jgi:hypothetical protein
MVIKLAIVLVLIALISGCETATPVPTPVVQFTATPARVASWDEQLSVVKRQGENIDKGAVISRISADLEECERIDDLDHAVRFFLLKPDGRNFEIYITDEGPVEVVKVGDVSREATGPPDLRTRQRLAEALKVIRVGPREACFRTLAERNAILGEDSWFFGQRVTMILDYDQQERYGVPTIWEVTFYAAGKAGTIEDDRNLKFMVSPVDGSILERLINFETITPAPSMPVSIP